MKSGSDLTSRASRLDVAAAEIELVGLLDLAGARRHDDEPRGEENRLFDRVGDEEHHLAGAMPDVEDQLLDLLAGQRVERAERLVHQQYLRVGGERAGDADALLHAAGELVDHLGFEILQADEVEFLARVGVALVLVKPRILRPNATLSMTLSQGISAWRWNTTPRSAPGP